MSCLGTIVGSARHKSSLPREEKARMTEQTGGEGSNLAVARKTPPQTRQGRVWRELGELGVFERGTGAGAGAGFGALGELRCSAWSSAWGCVGRAPTNYR